MTSQFTHLTDFKIPQIIFILFLQLFLGVTIAPSALSQETRRMEFPLKSLNAVHDAVKALLTNETTGEFKNKIQLLQMDLEEQILSDNLSIPQVIDVLIENISSRRDIKSTVHKRMISLKLIEELWTKYPPSEPEILKTVDMLIEVLPDRKLHNELHTLYLQFLEKILQQFVLPEKTVLPILDQMKRNLFYTSPSTKTSPNPSTKTSISTSTSIEKIIIRIMGQILIKVSDPVKDDIISWFEVSIKDPLWRTRLSTLLNLTYFLEQNLLPNPDHKRRITLIIKDRINDDNWGVRKQSIETSAIMLQRDILLSSDEKRGIALMIKDRINDDDWSVQISAIKYLSMLLVHTNILSDPDERREVALMIKDKINDDNWGVQEEAIRASTMLLRQKDILSDPDERREVALMIKGKVTNKNRNEGHDKRESITEKDWIPQTAAIKALIILLNQKDVLVLFNLIEIRDIAFLMIDQVTDPLTKKTSRLAASVLDILLPQEDILPDPNDKKALSIQLLSEISDESLETKGNAFDTLNTLLKTQPTLFDFNDRKQIAFALPHWLYHKNWSVQKKAFKLSDILLDYEDLPHFDKSRIYFKIAGFSLFHIQQQIRKRASERMKNLWNSDFPYEDKLKMMQKIAIKKPPKDSYGKREAIDVLEAALHAGLPFSFEIIDKVADKVSEPFPVGDQAKSFVQEAVEVTPLSEDERLMVFLKMDLLSRTEGNPSLSNHSIENTNCKKSYE